MHEGDVSKHVHKSNCKRNHIYILNKTPSALRPIDIRLLLTITARARPFISCFVTILSYLHLMEAEGQMYQLS